MINNNMQYIELSELLRERKEVPNLDDIITGQIPIIEKITFNDGAIQLRDGFKTKTNMILIEPGDLVISGINAVKGAIAVYDETNKKSIAATIHYSSYIPNKNKVITKYLWWLLRSKVFPNLLLKHLPGGIKTELKANRFLKIPIPYYDVSEQIKIVNKLDEISLKIKRINNLCKKIDKLNISLRTSIILDIIKDIEIDGVLSDVLVNKPRNGWSPRRDDNPEGIPVLSLGAVTGFEYNENQFKRTSEPTDRNAHYWLKKGDLLITRSNTLDLVGHAAIYNGSPNPCIYSDLMMKIVVDENIILKEFVHKWLSVRIVRDYIKENAKGTSPTMKKISQKIVMNIPFPTEISFDIQRKFLREYENISERNMLISKYNSFITKNVNSIIESVENSLFLGS